MATRTDCAVTAPRAHPQVVARKLGERWVLVHMESGEIFELNETAGYLWDLLGSMSDREELVMQVMNRFEAPRAVVEKDVDATIHRLVTARFLVPGK